MAVKNEKMMEFASMADPEFVEAANDYVGPFLMSLAKGEIPHSLEATGNFGYLKELVAMLVRNYDTDLPEGSEFRIVGKKGRAVTDKVTEVTSLADALKVLK